jgi:hypothetical protein
VARRAGSGSEGNGLAEEDLLEACPWSMDQAVDPDFWPE